jgi:hypothetical protein
MLWTKRAVHWSMVVPVVEEEIVAVGGREQEQEVECWCRLESQPASNKERERERERERASEDRLR